MCEMENISHECIEKFSTRKVDEYSGEGYNKCFGLSPMILEMWYEDTSLEQHFDNWMEMEVNFCPFCGLKAKKDDSDVY